MCITPQHAQWTVLFKTNPLLSVVLLIICLVPLGSAECPPGQFLHFNPETNIGVCCITRPLPIGYGFISCKVNGTLDRIEECPEGLHQPDSTTTESEAICYKGLECNQEEHLKDTSCDVSGQNCVSTCVCNYKREYCGKFSYDCKKFPKDCPSELVQRDCSCKRDPPPVTSSSPVNASNKPSQTIITSSSIAPADGGSKSTQENGETKDDVGVDINNGTANTNGSGSIPHQTQSAVLNAVVIAIGIVFAVGVVAVVVLVCICHRRVKNWLSKYRNFCCHYRSTNPEQVSLDSVLIFASDKSNQDEPCEEGKEEAQPFLSEVRSEDGYGDQQNLISDHRVDSSIQAGGTDIQSQVVDNVSLDSALIFGSGKSNQDEPCEEGKEEAQPFLSEDGSKGLCGDQKNPAGDHSEGGRSIQDGVTSIQSLVPDVAKTKDCGNEGLFCKCCNLPSSRCRKKKKDTPVGKVNGTRQRAQFLEMPSTGYVGSEMSVNGFVSFTSSINHDLESHDNTNAVGEETTHLKSVNSQEAACSDDQVLSIVQQRNEVERSSFEELQQTDFNDESHVPTGMTANEGPYRTDSHSGRTNHDEEELKIENEEDVEE